MPEPPPQTSTRVLTFFCALAATRLLITLVAHVASIFGALPLGNPFGALIPCIVVVWLPAMLGAQISRSTERKDIWKFLLQGSPV